MASLEELRAQLGSVDDKIVELYEERMKLCEEIGICKIENGYKTFDRQREKNTITDVMNKVSSDINKKGIGEVYEQLLAISRKLQYKQLVEAGALGRLPFIGIDLLDKDTARVVFQGTEGAYSQAAMEHYFGKDCNNYHVHTFREAMDNLMDIAKDIEANPEKYAHACEGKKLATLFYEPSTRTRLSHEAAMINLGGSVLGFSSADSSSASKGESVADTIRVISCFADICAMRHPKEGAAMVASQHATIPVINAGDGGHQHPTQTLTDMLTIRSLKGRLDNMTIGLCGDLKFGRTVHSLIHALVRYPGIRFVLISPEELKLPSYIKNDVLDRQNIPYEEVVRLEDALPDLDILYMTRVQKERFFNEEDYVRMKDFYILDNKKMELAKEDMYILHPLPRVNEIATEVDNDPRAAYFKQVQYGVYIRMALILTLLGIEV